MASEPLANMSIQLRESVHKLFALPLSVSDEDLLSNLNGDCLREICSWLDHPGWFPRENYPARPAPTGPKRPHDRIDKRDEEVFEDANMSLGAFILVQDLSDPEKFDLIHRHNVVNGKPIPQANIKYRKDNGPDYSRKVLCIGSKTSCLEQLAKLGGTVSPFPDVFMKEPSTGNLVKRLKIKKEKLTEQELRAQIDAKKPKGGRKGFIPLLNRSPSSPPRAVAPTPIRPSFSSHSSRDSSPVPPMATAAVAASPISSAELSAVKESLDELRKERQADRALLESIADRMLCKTGLKYNGPDFMEEQEVGHLSLHTASHFAFVRSLFDLIAEDEEEKKLEIEKRDRFKIRWVEEQYRKFRHPNPNGFSSGWKDTLRQFRKTLRRRDLRAKEHQTNTPLASPNHTTTD
ncbi:hypothetical protein PRIPAC_87045 [Pristionchus pacificus]|uniref:Uncharacterized protein n=1 Tax=Pristionchus pacificus TaxID=54126 RepID=A0A2A6BT24_PRIPA|nr:hypothetical protein PRIPAC_87045 [Pristionchus pacificus]|eukprot:PDM69054.1 hypothetical protein PRIPAC_47356 [Pristionchus pacificus]